MAKFLLFLCTVCVPWHDLLWLYLSPYLPSSVLRTMNINGPQIHLLSHRSNFYGVRSSITDVRWYEPRYISNSFASMGWDILSPSHQFTVATLGKVSLLFSATTDQLQSDDCIRKIYGYKKPHVNLMKITHCRHQCIYHGANNFTFNGYRLSCLY